MPKLIKFLSILAHCGQLPAETQADLQDLLPEIEAELEANAQGGLLNL